MELKGERRVPAPRERVWDALLDPGTLQRCLPRCKSFVRIGEGEYRAAAAATIGQMDADFTGEITLLDVERPASCRIEGSAQGGGAGFARGKALVSLAEDGAFTLLSYTIDAEVGGKLAQLGGRTVEDYARRTAEQFFEHLTAAVTGPVKSAADGMAGLAASIVDPAREQSTGHGSQAPVASLFAALPKEPMGFPLVAWIGGAAWLVIAFMLFSAYL
jgi:carbon monoxide dehydrogenase subunit G